MRRVHTNRFIHLASACTLALTPMLAAAQAVPNSIAPSHIEEQFNRKPIEPEKPLAPFIPELGVTPTQPAPDKAVETFLLHDVAVEDATVYPAASFKSIFADSIGKRITLAQAQDIVTRITARYRKDGYMLSQAIIPQQNLKNGILHIHVVEGFFDQVNIENNHPERDKRNLIKAYAEKIKKEHPANIYTLERYMLLITDLPGVSAQSVIKPSSTTHGAADLVIKVTNKAVDANFTSDNRGTKYIGPYQEQLSVSENSLAGIGERTTLTGINTLPASEMHYWSIEHEEQLDTEGTKLTLMASSVRTHPGDVLSKLDITGISDEFTATVSHPFIRSRINNLTGRIVFDAHNTDNEAFGNMLDDDRVRAARLGMNYNTSDRWNGINLADISISKGLSWPGATDAGSDRTRPFIGDQEFIKSNVKLSRLQDLLANFSLLTTASGQFTNNALLQSEQMTLGGTDFGRAYDTGEIVGDSGIAGKAELRYSHTLNNEWLNAYQLYSYYDIGTVHVNAATTGSDSQMSLASAGGGVRFNFIHNIYGYTEIDFPLTKAIASENNSDPRVFFSLSAQF